MQKRCRNGWLSGLCLALAMTACSSSHMEPVAVQGRPAMVDDAGQARLWVLGKQEEVRQVGVGGGNRRTAQLRSDTFFHFTLQAFDPQTSRPLWSQRLLTLGDPDAQGSTTSKVIGSTVDARLLGQDGALVWLLIGSAPMAVSVRDGRVVADAAAIEQRNPTLKGLLPSEAKYYSFDRGLVFMTADARPMVIEGEALDATGYAPTLAPTPEPERYANGRERVAPLMPYGVVPARQVTLGGQWLGLYTAREAADASKDQFGDRLRYPYTVLDERVNARRTFWRGTIVQAQRFDDRFPRIDSLQPIAGAPVFLNGRFVKDPANGNPLLMQAPDGVLVWSSTRIDQAGRLALTRLDTELKTVWKAELPLSEAGTANLVSVWLLPGRLVAMGEEETVVDDVTRREQHLVSVDLANGQWQGWDMPGERALPARQQD